MRTKTKAPHSRPKRLRRKLLAAQQAQGRNGEGGVDRSLYGYPTFRTMVRSQVVSMTIGRLAAGAGVSVETVRYYQRRGLLR